MRQDNKMMTPSLPSVVLIRSMRRTDKKMGSKDNTGHSIKEGFWQEFLSVWKWLNMLALPFALVFVSIMLAVEAVNGNLVTGVVLGLTTLAVAEIACTIMALSVQVMFSIFDLIDK